jgi:4-cresol dehydrogenase (hydroxylating) flavoprotein subunit
MSPFVQSAYSAFAEVVGEDFITREPVQIAAAETATFATSNSLVAIVRPADRAQTQDCVRVASRFGIPIFPISTGKNWGYGSRVPNTDGCVLLDLSRMNRIRDFSEKLAYVTVEPGVTQEQLYAFLKEQRSSLWMDATGSSPTSSLIGNTMERGFGHTPYGDHLAHACAFEVVLPNGECIETGFARYPGAVAAPVYRWGTGPSLDGLFSQSSLGIVTRMTIWLMPAPEYFQAFFFRCNHARDLGPAIDVLRPLRLSGTLRSAVHIANGYKVLSGMSQYPWEFTKGKTPLLPADLEELGRSLGFGDWNGAGGLYGTKAQVKEARRLIRRALSGKVAAIRFLDDANLKTARWATPLLRVAGWDLSRTLELVRPVYGLLKGIPTEQPLRSTYWRKRMKVPAKMDPDKDRCGLIWCAPIAPFDGEHAMTVSGLASRILLKHGFEPLLSLTLISERALTCVISITYDRDILGEDERAMSCHRDLVSQLTSSGYYFYRLGVQSMGEMGSGNGYTSTLRQIQNTFDPNRIMSPGRYTPSKTG